MSQMQNAIYLTSARETFVMKSGNSFNVISDDAVGRISEAIKNIKNRKENEKTS
jgi:hypothetical protein